MVKKHISWFLGMVGNTKLNNIQLGQSSKWDELSEVLLLVINVIVLTEIKKNIYIYVTNGYSIILSIATVSNILVFETCLK